MSAPRACPCHSGAAYAACCGPLHRGVAHAETPTALMRSRYAAFALGLGEYLWETLASTHADRALPRDPLVRELAATKHAQRFLGLTILEASDLEVLFHARIFARGRDVSFAELSTFVVEEGRFRYASGVLLTRDRLPADPASLTRAQLLALA